MPIIKNAKVTWVGDDPFKIPGSNLTINAIRLEHDNESEVYKTMSDKLAVVGWSGDVEVYTNDKGKTYVRQAPKENDFVAKGKSFQPKDEKSITLGLVFKTFASTENMLPSKPEHWNYIEKATVKLLEIGQKLNATAEPVEQSGYDSAKKQVEQIKQRTNPPVDDYGNADIGEEPFNLDDIPF